MYALSSPSIDTFAWSHVDDKSEGFEADDGTNPFAEGIDGMKRTQNAREEIIIPGSSLNSFDDDCEMVETSELWPAHLQHIN